MRGRTGDVDDGEGGRMRYTDFIDKKAISALHTDSIQIDKEVLNPKLYDFQKDIVRWALAKGRAAIFADCGLGKTPMQLEWADQIIRERGGDGPHPCPSCSVVPDCSRRD